MTNDVFEKEKTPSRSAKKRAAKSVEDLAVRLVDLAERDFRRLPLEGQLLRELKEARAIKAHGARKRQIKHLAGLLRRDEESRGTAEEFLAELDLGYRRDAERFHHLEDLRERLCDPQRCEAALEEVGRTLPEIDLGRVRRLAAAARGGADKRAFRELFRLLRDGDRDGRKFGITD